MNIRTATESDAESIWQLNKALGYEYPFDDTAKRMRSVITNPNHRIFVAEINGVVTGYIHLVDYDTLYFDPLKNVLALTVLPEYRRKGIATRLLVEAAEWAKATGASGIRLDSGIDRVGAHICYRKNGYQEIKLHKYFKKLF